MPYYSQTTSTRPDAYFLLMVSEKADAREIDDTNLGILKSQTFNSWLAAEIPLHDIAYNLDSTTLAWIEYRLAKMPTPKPMPVLTPVLEG